MNSQEFTGSPSGALPGLATSLSQLTIDSTSVVAYPAGRAAMDVFMADLAVRAREVLAEQSNRSKELRTRDRWLYRAAVATAVASPILVVLGTILIVTGVAAGGALLTAAGLLGGPATKALRRMQREASAELAQVATARQESVRLYWRLMLVQQIPDPVEQTKQLRGLVGPLTTMSDQAKELPGSAA